MSPTIRTVLTCLLLGVAAAAPARAHGGGHGSPNPGASPWVKPSTTPGGAAAPASGGAAPMNTGAAAEAAAKARARTASGPRTGRSRASNRRGARTAVGNAAALAPERTTWEFWWRANQDAFLDLKARLSERAVVSGGAGFLTGRGRKEDALSASRRTAEQVRHEIVPTLQMLMLREDDANILDSSAVALGRVADPSMPSTVRRSLETLVDHEVLEVRWSAVLGMGVLGASDHTELLVDLMADTSAGRAAVGGPVDWQVRAFSALALGYLDDPRALPALMDVVENAPDSDRDLKACAVLGLGLVGNGRVDEIVYFLRGRLEDRQLDPAIAAQIPIALGRLGDPSVLTPLLATFVGRDTDRRVQASIAVAFGRLATLAHRAVVESLLDVVEQGNDVATRHFALIALGKIGARSPRRQATDELRARVLGFLTRRIHDPDRRTDRSWAALGAALWARESPGEAPGVVGRLRLAYEDEKDPSYKAAYAIALALAGASEAAPAIHEDFLASGDEGFRGYAAVALGMLRHRPAREPLLEICGRRAVGPLFRRQAAVALGLMGDPETVPMLVDVLRTTDTLGVAGAVVEALGLIGDRRAVDMLTALATDESVGALTRALACVALGRVGEKTDLPWNAPIRIDSNYLLESEAVAKAASIL